MNLKPFLDALAAKQPTPGGGSASALGGALGAALGSMAANYTVGNAKYEAFDAPAREALAKLEALRGELLQWMDSDMAAYELYRAALALPKNSPEEKSARSRALAIAREEATSVPERILNAAYRGLEIVLALSAASNPNLAGDVASSAYFFEACARAAAIQVFANCAVSDAPRCSVAEGTVARCQELREKIHAAVLALMAQKK